MSDDISKSDIEQALRDIRAQSDYEWPIEPDRSNSHQPPPLKALESAMQSVKAITEIDELSERAIADRHSQAKAEAEQLPEGPEREAALNKAWVEFARANQRAHERYMRTMRELLGEPEQGA